MATPPPFLARFAAPLVPSRNQMKGTGVDVGDTFGIVREIRAEIQNLQESLAQLRAKSALVDKQVRDRETLALFAELDELFRDDSQQINARLVELRERVVGNPQLYAQLGDDIAHLENTWRRALRHWPAGSQNAEEITRHVEAMDAYLHRIIRRCGQITIPERVQSHLRQLKVGRALDFHETFRDELPEQSDRTALLVFLHDHPRAVQGVVDVEAGLIHKVSSNHFRRIVSYALPLLFAAIGFALLPLVSRLFSDALKGISTESIRTAYLGVIAGGFVHVVVGAIKESRSPSSKTFLSIDDWLIWLHVKEMPITLGVISLWIGFIGLIALNKGNQFSTAFFIGYSADSLVDVFLNRFGDVVSAKTAALKKQLA